MQVVYFRTTKPFPSSIVQAPPPKALVQYWKEIEGSSHAHAGLHGGDTSTCMFPSQYAHYHKYMHIYMIVHVCMCIEEG